MTETAVLPDAVQTAYEEKLAAFNALTAPKGIPLAPSTPRQLEKGRFDYPVSDGTQRPAEQWSIEAIAIGPEDGDWRACKLLAMLDHEPNNGDDASFRAKVSAQFRVQYGEWAAKLSTKKKRVR